MHLRDDQTTAGSLCFRSALHIKHHWQEDPTFGELLTTHEVIDLLTAVSNATFETIDIIYYSGAMITTTMT